MAAQQAISGFEKRPTMWVLRPQIIDAFSFILFIGLIGLNVIATMSGLFMDNNNIKMTKLWITIHYLGWSFFCWIIIFGIVYFGKKLISIIEKHILDTKGHRKASSKVRSLELGLIKLRRVRVLLLSDLFFFAISSLLFGLFREQILTYSIAISLLLATCWILIVPLTNAIIITILAYEINEKTRMPAFRPKTSTHFQTTRSNDDFTVASLKNFPPKTVRNDRNYPSNQRGITMHMEQTVSINNNPSFNNNHSFNNNSSFTPGSKALESPQDFMETTSDQSHISRDESGDSIELV
ncbi:4610_t:CDS:2, partial [Racocetra persica]